MGNSACKSIKASLEEGRRGKGGKEKEEKKRKRKMGRKREIREEEKERGNEGGIAIMAIDFCDPEIPSLLHLLMWENQPSVTQIIYYVKF